jgi:hypothetical protein
MSPSFHRHKLIGLFIFALVCLALAEEPPTSERQSGPSARRVTAEQANADFVETLIGLLSAQHRARVAVQDTALR